MTNQNLKLLKDVVPGVYMAMCEYNDSKYKAAVSVGWNPVFDNKVKTLEAYLISNDEIPDFHNSVISVNLLRYIRPEALFGDFDGLLIAISADI